ncbi:Protein of unknown function [Cotesia congregata]|uniref:Uncharacterized protein n=1 Tax=Cotesia congregata TaxID=51543 RepID=A0A8J2HJZ7_COTCN|nr:Protein of unknown function [Cotesia congregata]
MYSSDIFYQLTLFSTDLDRWSFAFHEVVAEIKVSILLSFLNLSKQLKNIVNSEHFELVCIQMVSTIPHINNIER